MGLLGNGYGFLGLSKSNERGFINGIGFGLIIMGVYLLLAYFNVVPFSSRFPFLDSKSRILIISIVLIVAGVLLNEKIRNIFRK